MPTPIRRVRRRASAAGGRVLQPLTVLWLVILWFLLWGRVSLGLAASGLLVAVLVLVLFPLPEIAVQGRPRPLRTVLFLLIFLWDVVRASAQVVRLALRRNQEAETAVIGVALVTRSDLMTTMVASVLTLIPGSIVIEVDRTGGILYLHLIGVASAEDIERERRHSEVIEARMIRAFGSPADRQALKRARASTAGAPAVQDGTSASVEAPDVGAGPGREDQR